MLPTLPIPIVLLLSVGCRDSVTGPSSARVRLGIWGGEAAGLQVTESGGTASFLCGQGTIDEPMLLDRDGRFDVSGTLEGKLPPSRPARYSGRVDGDRIILTVRLRDSDFEATHSLTYGILFPGRICR